MPWARESVDADLQGVLAGHRRLVAARWEEAFEDLDEDVLGEAAQEARRDGQGAGRAVDVLVRGLIRQLEEWKQADTGLEESLAAAALGRPLPVWAADALAAEQGRLWGARQALLEAVARHHHGGPAPW
ncbi:hypothetical protein ACIRRH_42230 [Kitasatospora sp. NPDC101235]|uniref:hypothetical protein n=1 Tax=Kitasatospora sp. NPDC101235 TaxID=3364101 RepID=UPI0037F2CBFE